MSISNYVATPTQVQGTADGVNDPDYLGHNLKDNLVPPQPAATSYTEFVGGCTDPVRQSEHYDPASIARRLTAQMKDMEIQANKMFWDSLDIPVGSEGSPMDRPNDESTTPSNPVREHAEHNLRYNQLHRSKFMRAI